MTVIYMLKFYRAAFGDTKYPDIPFPGSSLEEAKAEACEALFARFKDMKAAGKGREAPIGAALLDDNDDVIARFQVRPKINGRGGEEAVEMAPQIWRKNQPGKPSPEIRELQDRDQ